MSLNANALVTLALAKNWLKIPMLETSQDTLVEMMINGFSQEAESLCNRKLTNQSITEYKHGRGTNLILLKEWPVTAIASVTIDASGQFTTADPLDAQDFSLADDQNTIVLFSGTFPRGYNNIKIVYTAGYVAVPGDLQQAILDLCFWKNRVRESGDIGRIQKGKASESEQWTQEWPKGPLNTVMRYKRTEMPGIDAPPQNY